MVSVEIENRRVHVSRTRFPRRPRGFALIRLLVGGICNTDLELLRGYYGFSGIPGHEFVGEVVEADDAQWNGRRVVGEINLGCGKCDWCLRGLRRHCPSRKVLGIVRHPGAFREFLTLPEINLHAVPPSVSNEQAVFTEPLAAACEILDQVDIPQGSTVAVLGDGKLGLLIAQVLHARGLKVHQYGRHRDKLRIAAGQGVQVEVVRGKLPAAVYDWIVEATGSRSGLQQAVQMARPRGTIVMKSTVHGTVPIDTAPIIVNEVTLVGSRCGRFLPAMELLESGKINVVDMLSDTFPLPDAPKAFRRAAQKGVLKVLLYPRQ
jgi:threonine dehydrogenase-like Zn-dependent dehydrogenase